MPVKLFFEKREVNLGQTHDPCGEFSFFESIDFNEFPDFAVVNELKGRLLVHLGDPFPVNRVGENGDVRIRIGIPILVLVGMRKFRIFENFKVCQAVEHQHHRIIFHQRLIPVKGIGPDGILGKKVKWCEEEEKREKKAFF